MKNSHKVQSTRAAIEQTFADLKNFKVMDSNKIKSAADFEKVLDCVLALHNLKILLKLVPNFDLPARRYAIPREHVFGPKIPEKDFNLSIPADAPNLANPDMAHINKFINFLPSAIPTIRKTLNQAGSECVFRPAVLERGGHLYEGAYVLQLQVQNEGLDIWTVKYTVGASYSYETHTGYVQIRKDNAVLNHICDCYSG